jgi:hypothetical protein
MDSPATLKKGKERKESRGETQVWANARLLNMIPTDNVPGKVFKFALHNTPSPIRRIVISTHPVLLDASHNPC